jgi:acyl carrier protein
MERMDRKEVFDQVVAILRPFVKNPSALASLGDDTAILRDLKVNSARLVEVLIRIQGRFDIDVDDDEAEKVRTIGDAVALIVRSKGAA